MVRGLLKTSSTSCQSFSMTARNILTRIVTRTMAMTISCTLKWMPRVSPTMAIWMPRFQLGPAWGSTRLNTKAIHIPTKGLR